MKIKVRVRPNSNKEELIKISDSEFCVYLKEKTEDGKANLRLINVLAKQFKVIADQLNLSVALIVPLIVNQPKNLIG